MVKRCIHIAETIGSIPIPPTMFATDEKSLERDTLIEFFRGSGPGGQNRNKLETGVRLTHKPSGIVLEVSEERTQIQNRKIAFERLKERLEKLNTPRKVRKISKKLPRAAKENRLKEKHYQSKKKALRQLSENLTSMQFM